MMSRLKEKDDSYWIEAECDSRRGRQSEAKWGGERETEKEDAIAAGRSLSILRMCRCSILGETFRYIDTIWMIFAAARCLSPHLLPHSTTLRKLCPSQDAFGDD